MKQIHWSRELPVRYTADAAGIMAAAAVQKKTDLRAIKPADIIKEITARGGRLDVPPDN